MAFSISRTAEKFVRFLFRCIVSLLRRVLAVIVALFALIFLGATAATTALVQKCKFWIAERRTSNRKPPA